MRRESLARLLHFNAFTTLFRLWTQLLNSREFSSTTRLSSKLLLLEKEKQSKWQQQRQQSKLEVDDTRNAFCIPSCLKSSSTGCCYYDCCLCHARRSWFSCPLLRLSVGRSLFTACSGTYALHSVKPKQI